MYIISSMETPRQVKRVLSALGEQLERAGERFELVVIGGSALVALGFVGRAVADQGTGRHEADLRALNPSREELLAAARWARTHDPSPGFLESLHSTLAVLGVEDADLGA
jgi:hypothetical protein